MKQENNLEDKLYKIRHSLAHVLAQAVLEIRPNSKLAFGPPIDNGCYYDFDLSSGLTAEDFPEIEKKIRKIIAEKQKFSSYSKPLSEAVSYLESRGENYKAEYCKELGTNGESEIGFYENGPFTDMCAGPHLEHTGQIPPDCFRIDTLAGAYWRGSEKNKQLTRIYCLAFNNKQELKEYTEKRELAKQRDHRKLGKELEIFTISDEVGSGLPLWLPNGTILRDQLELLAKETEARAGYVRVSTPHITKSDLFYKSGHLPYYADGMFPPMDLKDEAQYYLKPMNCPFHHLIFGHRPRSYRELPLRLAEYGTCYRYESHGSLSGLLRVRMLSMNDAHIYCTVAQIKSELTATFKMIFDYFNFFRFKNVKVRFSTHDPENKEKFIDNPELWAYTEKAVEDVLKEIKADYFIGKGEAAFYGPKIDIQAESVLGREETLCTTQLDFAAGERFELKYVDENGQEQTPFVIHRAPLSTHERLLAFLIEHFGGAFPTWLSPRQAVIIPINESCQDFAAALAADLQKDLYRVELDLSSNSFNKKIREAVTAKTPNILIIGNKEMENNSVTWRRYCVQEQKTVTISEFKEKLSLLTRNRIMDNFPDVTY
jgi:threonyl-tRNA synthetase